MKKALAALAAVALVGTGCMVRIPVARTHAASAGPAGKPCPPGHLWSDGRCHDKGKGHDKQNKRER
jgi:hypothetical protein